MSVDEAMNNAGAFLYWAMSPDSNLSPAGRLYRWDLEGTDVANISLGLGAGDVIAPIGFAEVRAQMAFYGTAISQTPGDSGVVATLIDAGDPFHVDVFDVVCKSSLAMDVPTAYAAVSSSRLVFASGGTFSLVSVPAPRSTLPEVAAGLVRRNVLGQCPAVSFGLPPTCLGCSPPSSLCGMTEHCPNGCCFVVGARVMCCKSSPPGLAMPGFSCA